MILTLRQAAKAANKSPSTLSKAIADGRLSTIGKKGNSYQIEASELFRLFPSNNKKNEYTDTNNEQPNTKNQAEINLLKKELEAAKNTIDELRADKTYLQGELSKTTTLLADQREKPPEKPVEPPKRFFGIFPRRTS